MLLVAHRAIPGTSLSRSVSGACVIERCSPWSGPFPPQPPRKLALLCSTGSRVLRHSPTSLVRACPLFGLWPLRTGLVLSNKTYERSPGSRACCFSACAGSQTTQDLTSHSRIAWLPCCLPPSRKGVVILIHQLFKAQYLCPLVPLVYALRYNSRCTL